MNLSDFREDYQRGALDRASLNANPIAQFESWFQAAIAAQPQRPDANAMALATADRSGKPSVRTVLLKAVDERGFIFFTNYDSRKGRELAENPNAALTFFWPDLERQVCVAGTVTKLPVPESEAYFHSRPRASQLAAWASDQSKAVPDRAALEARWHELEQKFPGAVPLPPNWGGYILKPERIEFWQGRPSRLHDRFSYARQADGSWEIERLSP
jgi:pyridoxamine 5'-phosphate oxidase